MSTEHFEKYFDVSEAIINYYSDQPVIGLEATFHKIETYLEHKTEANKPLIIVSDANFGLKTFLVKWMLYHRKNFKRNYALQDILLPYFVTATDKNQDYVYAIFRFLIQLREHLNVKQKVELIEDKLRKYFSYWLGVCHRKLE